MPEDDLIPPDMAGMQWWGSKEIQRLLPYSHTQITKLARDGKIPAPVKIGGKLLWRPARMAAFLRAAISKSEERAVA